MGSSLNPTHTYLAHIHHFQHKMWIHSLYNNEYKWTNTHKGALKVQMLTRHENTNCHFTTIVKYNYVL